jgi:hypothetical protein
MKTLNEIKKIIEMHKQELEEKYNVSEIGIFGSYVSGEKRQNSDLDILVSFSKAPSFFGYLEVEEYLTDLLGVEVDLVIKRALKPNIGKNILDKVVYV